MAAETRRGEVGRSPEGSRPISTGSHALGERRKAGAARRRAAPRPRPSHHSRRRRTVVEAVDRTTAGAGWPTTTSP